MRTMYYYTYIEIYTALKLFRYGAKNKNKNIYFSRLRVSV